MTQASQVITQQFKGGSVVGADLQGQNAVSKKYVDDQLAIRDTNIDAAAGAAGAAQASIDNHAVDPKAHPAQNITYSGTIAGATNVKQAVESVKSTLDQAMITGDSGPEALAARYSTPQNKTYASLKDRLDASDIDLNNIKDSSSKDFDNIYNPLKYGAVGNGTTNDTAAFAALEIVVVGRQVDLGNRTYVVDSVPKKNRYYNGYFKVSGYTRSVVLDAPPRFHAYGGQLAKLKASLSSPLEQYTGIVFIGDSITWGRTLAENGVFDPRDGTLSDPRDVFASPSFVNEFKRYVGAQYAYGAAPVFSNWVASPSGESTVEYTVQQVLYPKDGDFILSSTGSSVSVSEVQSGLSITGHQLQLIDGNVAGTSSQSIKFTFTGDSLTLSFGIVESDATWYDLYVDGVKIGTYSNHVGVDGFVAGNDQRRTHMFNYVKNKVVEIRTNRNGETTGNRRLRIEGIIINKKIRITNQGINGATSKTYKTYNLVGNTSGDGVAVEAKDNYVFVQLGTNDRIIRADTPKGSNEFKKNLKSLLDVIQPLANVILMCANPVSNESINTYSFTMQQARGVILDLAKSSNIDFIDNYAACNLMDISAISQDGTHPNALGHQLIARNIIGALEMS